MKTRKSKMVTEVYFIEGLYLYTKVGSSGRGVLASGEHVCARTVNGSAERGAS